jgi:heme-NO-binding protein
MHGIVFAELKRYVVTNLGADTWNALLDKAGMPGTTFLPGKVYDDGQAMKLVATASEMTGKPAGDILESFGEFIAPDLLNMYGAQVNPAWKTLELLEHTEEVIHRMVRMRSPGAAPPELRVERVGPDEVVVHYTSKRHMCSLAKGIARGLGAHYGQALVMREPACMLKGDAACRIHVKVAR